MRSLIKKRRYAIVASAVIFSLGLWAASLLLLSALKDISGADKSFSRMLAPGEQTMELKAAGLYTVYFESKGEFEGKVYLAPEGAPSGLELMIEEAATGERVPVKLARSKSTYSLGSREGASIMEFFAQRPGEYRFKASVQEGWGKPPPFVLAVGRGFLKGIFVAVAKIFALVFVLIAAVAIPTALIAASSAAKLGSQRSGPEVQ